jgi:hypothetical protein
MLRRGAGASHTRLHARGSSLHAGMASARPSWSVITRLSEV